MRETISPTNTVHVEKGILEDNGLSTQLRGMTRVICRESLKSIFGTGACFVVVVNAAYIYAHCVVINLGHVC